MSCLRLQGGLLVLCLILGSRMGMAIDAGTIPTPSNPASANPDLSTPATPSVMALPANSASPSLPGDASSVRKFYTLSASLREIYDDNVNTSNINPKTSYETELSPSVLVDFPTPDGDFSGRYTFGLTYYSVGPDTGDGNDNSPEVEYTHDFIAQYNHNFSDRFNLALAEEFRSYTEPSLDQSTGTSYQNGAYVTNVFNGSLNSQWTPLFGTSTNYSNTILRYNESQVAFDQDSVENTGTQSFSFAVFPKVSLSFGGIVDDIQYDDIDRGYISYTGFLGAQWQALPSLTLSGRVGGTYTETEGDVNSTQTSPYAALSLSWGLGAHSSLSFSYAHEVTPAEQIGANGQTSDRLSAGFNYNITANLSAHLTAIYTYAVIDQDLINSDFSGITAGYTQTTYEFDPGITYHYDQYLDFDAGFTISGVSSSDNSFDYERNQAYLGVRGTY